MRARVGFGKATFSQQCFLPMLVHADFEVMVFGVLHAQLERTKKHGNFVFSVASGCKEP